MGEEFMKKNKEKTVQRVVAIILLVGILLSFVASCLMYF